jgi:hypothetical protein
MALTDIEICSNALIRLGAKPIQSFNDPSDTSVSCGAIYKIKRAYLLSSYVWGFSLKYSRLARQLVSPLIQWKNQFTLPTDKLHGGMMAVFNSPDPGVRHITGYSLIGQVLMSNYDDIYVEYQYDVDESLWTHNFTELMINIMMVDLCYLITDSSQLYQELRMATYGTPSEGGQGGLLSFTRSLDARDAPTMRLDDFSLLDARNGGYDWSVR